MKKLVFATNNVNKLKEIRHLLIDDYIVSGLKDIGCFDDIPETSDTLKGNALIKARYVKSNFELDCFADDTGLEIEALKGRPGVHSARYAGDECIAENNIRKVMNEMQGIPNRKARFKTYIALIMNNMEYGFEGIIHGKIISEKRGNKGFGYDPIFIPEGYDITFAEMPLEEKNKISHRAIAMNKLTDFLRKNAKHS